MHVPETSWGKLTTSAIQDVSALKCKTNQEAPYFTALENVLQVRLTCLNKPEEETMSIDMMQGSWRRAEEKY
jgi:hypothetical protein